MARNQDVYFRQIEIWKLENWTINNCWRVQKGQTTNQTDNWRWVLLFCVLVCFCLSFELNWCLQTELHTKMNIRLRNYIIICFHFSLLVYIIEWKLSSFECWKNFFGHAHAQCTHDLYLVCLLKINTVSFHWHFCNSKFLKYTFDPEVLIKWNATRNWCLLGLAGDNSLWFLTASESPG